MRRDRRDSDRRPPPHEDFKEPTAGEGFHLLLSSPEVHGVHVRQIVTLEKGCKGCILVPSLSKIVENAGRRKWDKTNSTSKIVVAIGSYQSPGTGDGWFSLGA